MEANRSPATATDMRRALAVSALVLASACSLPAQNPASPAPAAPAPAGATPLAIGETFTIPSAVMNETRRINVYLPAGYTEAAAERFPVLYMPDGGIAEDFLHVAGLVQVGAGNGTMRPFILVGIENTERRRDMTGPTTVEADRRIARHVGGSAAFRTFIRTELMPQIRQRYRTTAETAIVGESLAGLFVVETFLLEPGLFDTYIAFDPSLWWNDRALVRGAGERLRGNAVAGKTIFLASSGDAGLEPPIQSLAADLKANEARGLRWSYLPMPEEGHATIYHPAALRAFRTLFKPAPAPVH
jgi:uncharacterized protein